MKVNERKRNNNNLRKITLLDNEGNQGASQNVIIEEADGNVVSEGTPITTELFDCINWKDNERVEFKNLDTNDLPQAIEGKTQIVAKQNGELWVIPKSSQGLSPFKVITSTEPCILGVRETESIDGKAVNTGLKVDSNKNLVLEKAGAVASNGTANQFGGVSVNASNGLTITNGVVALNKATTSGYGTVKVTNGNGLKVESGVVSMTSATQSASGALSSSDKKFIDQINGGTSTSNFNEATDQGIYRGVSASNAPTTDGKYLCFTNVYSGIVNQKLINLNTGSLYVRRRVNGNWTQYVLTDKEGVLLYDSTVLIGANTTIQLGMDLYNEGFKKIKITMYEFTDESDDDVTRLYYDSNFSKEIILHEYVNDDSSYTRISFYEVTSVDTNYVYFIKGFVEGNKIVLNSLTKGSSSISTIPSNYRVIIEAFR